MLNNYKKLYENFVNRIEWLWNDIKNKIHIVKNEDDKEFYEGYFNTLSDFYVDYLSKYKAHDQICNIKIINYRKRYLDIVKRINNLYDQAIDEYKFYGPDNNYIKGFSCCARDLITFIAIVSK